VGAAARRADVAPCPGSAPRPPPAGDGLPPTHLTDPPGTEARALVSRPRRDERPTGRRRHLDAPALVPLEKHGTCRLRGGDALTQSSGCAGRAAPRGRRLALSSRGRLARAGADGVWNGCFAAPDRRGGTADRLRLGGEPDTSRLARPDKGRHRQAAPVEIHLRKHIFSIDILPTNPERVSAIDGAQGEAEQVKQGQERLKPAASSPGDPLANAEMEHGEDEGEYAQTQSPAGGGEELDRLHATPAMGAGEAPTHERAQGDDEEEKSPDAIENAKVTEVFHVAASLAPLARPLGQCVLAGCLCQSDSVSADAKFALRAATESQEESPRWRIFTIPTEPLTDRRSEVSMQRDRTDR